MTKELKLMQESRVPLGVFGSILMVWAAMGVFGAITSAVNHAWGVEKQPSYFKHKLISFLMLVMASLLLLAALLLISAINVVEASWFAGVVARTPGLQVLQGIALKWASTIAFIFVVGLVFYFVPNAKVRFRDVWVGAVVTGLAVARRARGFLVVRARSIAVQRPRIDCRGRGVSRVGLHLCGHPAVRRGGHRCQRALETPAARADPGGPHTTHLSPLIASYAADSVENPSVRLESRSCLELRRRRRRDRHFAHLGG